MKRKRKGRKISMLKFSYVSSQWAYGLYYGFSARAMQKPGEIRDCFAALVEEICLLSRAMGADLGPGVTARNLAILDGVKPEMTTSLQRDILRGGASELEGIIPDVPRLGVRYGVSLPTYKESQPRCAQRTDAN